MEGIKEMFEQRTSVRRYERENISEEAIDTVYAAIRNTPTSYNGQQFSVIDVTDQDVKEKLYELTGQKQIKTCNHFMVFCVDYNKIKELADAKGLDVPDFTDTLDGIMVGIIDASLAMGSALIAAQSFGLGTCCIGYTRTAAPREIADLLELPKRTFVICGLAIGVPREHPDVKPKQPQEVVIHQNHYQKDGLVDYMKEYDKMIAGYNQSRSGDKTNNDWCDHILDYYREAMNYRMHDYIVSQGFGILK